MIVSIEIQAVVPGAIDIWVFRQRNSESALSAKLYVADFRRDIMVAWRRLRRLHLVLHRHIGEFIFTQEQPEE